MELLFNEDFVPFLHYSGELFYKKDEPFFKPMHNHPELAELLLICDGDGEYNIGGEIYKVQPQSLIIYNPGVWHEERSIPERPHNMLYVGFSNFQVKNLEFNHLIHSNFPSVIPIRNNYLEIKDLFQQIIFEDREQFTSSKWITNHLLAALLGLVMRELLQEKKASSKVNNQAIAVKNAKKYIRENYHNNISLNDLSNVTYLSPFHFSRIFKEGTGYSPYQYLLHYRIEVAEHLLVNTDTTIENIAGSVGYKSSTHFQNLFKKVTGTSPGEYRKQ